MNQKFKSDTALLIPDTVFDIAHFAEHPKLYLMSVTRQPKLAAELWHERENRGLLRSDGRISMFWDNIPLIDPQTWGDTEVSWYQIIDMISAYLTGSFASAIFWGDPTEYTIQNQGSDVNWIGPGGRRIMAPKSELVSGILEGAKSFFNWKVEYAGGNERETLHEIDMLFNQATT